MIAVAPRLGAEIGDIRAAPGSVIASAEILAPDSTSGSTRALISGRAARAIGGERWCGSSGWR